MSNQPEKKQKVVYVQPEYSFAQGCACPTCGKEMDQAVYYVAEFGGQYSNSQWQGCTKRTTTVTHYRNIRGRVGGFCVDCYKKERKANIIIELILAVVLLAVTVLCAIKGGPSIIIALISGFYCLRWFVALLADVLRYRDLNGKTNKSKRDDTLSLLFVDAYKNAEEKPCGSNEVLMNSSTYRDLNKQNAQ